MSERFDLYRLIHKGLRACMADALLCVGRLDPQDAAELQEAAQKVRSLLFLCRSHLEKENRHVHGAMEARRPGSAAQAESEHRNHLLAIDWLEQCLRELETADAAARAAAAHRLYQQLALFTAENYEHMHHEETRHNEALWAAYSDAELLQIHHGILASLTPQESGTAMQWILPSVTPAERAALLSGMREHAPAPVFEELLGRLRQQLAPAAWRKLAGTLELPLPPLDLQYAVSLS